MADEVVVTVETPEDAPSVDPTPEPVVVVVDAPAESAPEEHDLDMVERVVNLERDVREIQTKMFQIEDQATTARMVAEEAASTAEIVAEEVAEDVAEDIAEEVAEEVAEDVAPQSASVHPMFRSFREWMNK